ncbi:uncharacterized protein LOC134726498 [Mytilus trossulus]|uniref:uncharacterized protein LOC134726498 n=1 Tax=Mytilus trossulus TaxID=6551 RepID=UPI003005DBEC
MSSLTCLVIGKDVYKTKQVQYCERKLRNFYCDGTSNSIIFRLHNTYLQWLCHELSDPLDKTRFRVISRKHNDDAYTTFANSEILNNHDNATPTTGIQIEVSGDGNMDLSIGIIVGSAVFLGTIIVFLLFM